MGFLTRRQLIQRICQTYIISNPHEAVIILPYENLEVIYNELITCKNAFYLPQHSLIDAEKMPYLQELLW